VKAELTIPDKLVPIFEGEARYRGAYGGRGSGKTRTFALMTAVRGYQLGKAGIGGQILCGREHLNSLDESSMEEIKVAIRSVPWLLDYYELGEKYIRSKDGRINYVFAGLRRNVDSLKSKARILLAWVDEAETVSETAWSKLLPTIREENSECWVTWNPESKHSATHHRFRVNTPDNSKIVECNWSDNPWFPNVLDAQRREDLEKRPDNYEHIWEGQFLTFTEGAYYAVEMREMRAKGRITTVDYERILPVVTAWDLGMGDSTAIWFAQYHGTECRLIDYYEMTGVGLDHYARVLQEKGYVYGEHILPHDVRVRELGTGKSRFEVLQSLGLNNISIAPQLTVDDGIQATRSLLSRAWIDEQRCEPGIEALQQYHREFDENNKTWKSRPAHDWSSHCADALRYMAVGYRDLTSWGSGPIRRGLRGIA
jgi:phage terminase large subunit